MTDLFTDVVGPRDAAISLLFMHGPGLDHTCFRPSVEALACKHQLIFYDARLCGRSPRNGPATGLDVLADDLEHVAKTVATGAVVAVAHSFAPLVAFHAALRLNTAVKALILVTPGVSASIGHTLLNYVQANGTEAQRYVIERAFAGRITSDLELEEGWRTILPLYLAQHNEQIANEVLGAVRFSAAGFNSFVEHAAGRLDWQLTVAQSRIPMLVIAGAHDWVERDPSGGSRAIVAASSNAKLHILTNSAHFPFAEEPDAFVNIVDGWLAECEDQIVTARRQTQP
jgi:proline iminopeptidase